MQPEEDDLSSLEKVREKLYAPTMKTSDPHVTFAGGDAQDLQHTWAHAPDAPINTHKHMRFATKFFIGSLVFFLIASGFAAYLFLSGSRSVSTDNIAIGLQGPTTVAGGDTVPLALTITNKNPVAITDAVITIDFPEGTRSADNVMTPFPRYSENLGTIAPGATITRSVRAVVFGSGGEQVTLPVSLSYGTQSSNATFIKPSSYTLGISTAPISVSIASLNEVVSGKPLTFDVTVRSNATTPIDNVVLAAQYPFGFNVSATDPTGVGNSFEIGTLAPGDSKVIKITGVLTGTQGETRVFRFTVGTGNSSEGQGIAVAYMTQDATVNITAPFLATTLTLNGSSVSDNTVAAGATVQARISWTNTLATAVQNATIEVRLIGTAFDPTSVRVGRGFYRSSDSTIVFTTQTDPSLSSLAPGATGIGSFSFAMLPASELRNSTLTLTTSVAGTRSGQSGVPESVSATVTNTLKVATALVLDTYGLHTSGPFVNRGPVPPVANTETTYTIIWNAKNSANAIAGATVTATLPPYVRFTGVVLPTGDAITYDEASRTVSWNAGDVSAGASLQAAFQVGFTPSVNQRGTSPILVNTPTITGVDRFAQVQVTGQGVAVTTQTSRDSGYSPNLSDVQ